MLFFSSVYSQPSRVWSPVLPLFGSSKRDCPCHEGVIGFTGNWYGAISGHLPKRWHITKRQVYPARHARRYKNSRGRNGGTCAMYRVVDHITRRFNRVSPALRLEVR